MESSFSLNASQATLTEMLWSAVQERSFSLYKVLLQQGADPFAPRFIKMSLDDFEPPRRCQDKSLLGFACEMACSEVVRHLLSAGADPNEPVGTDRTSALLAWVKAPAPKGHEAEFRLIGELLMEAGAHPHLGLPSRFHSRRASAADYLSSTPNPYAKELFESFRARQERKDLDACVPPAANAGPTKKGRL